MALELTDCQFNGPAFPEPFVKFELEKELKKKNLLPKEKGKEPKELEERWGNYRRKLRAMSAVGGELHVQNHVMEPLLDLLGYNRFESSENIPTVEEPKAGESGGTLLVSSDGKSKLRLWSASYNEDLYAPTKRGRAYRYSHLRIAQRVLKATGERLGILTNGVEIILLISEPARVDSTITFAVDTAWLKSRAVADSFKFFLGLCSPDGVASLPDLIDKARLQQATVTKELRTQARQAVERFIQNIIDHPENQQWYQSQSDKDHLAKELWHEGLVIVYRLLFILKLESSDDPARVFSFASNALWRNTYSPAMALAEYAQEVLKYGAETGTLLESGVKTIFRMFESGVTSTELNIKPLGGALFGENTTPHLSGLTWGEQAVAHILDQLLWTNVKRGSETRERVHYGSLDVEDLGRVYEALLELDAGITSEAMCRLRRSKLEVVVPVAQGEKYKPVTLNEDLFDDFDSDDEDDTTAKEKTKVKWIEEIPTNRFFLRVGLGRKATGSYYTPHSFVKFLVQETLTPLLAEHSPEDDPQPTEFLKLKIIDPAMGSGHFLAEACRFLGARLYEACRYCDEKALEADRLADEAKNKDEQAQYTDDANQWRQRIIDLPDPDDEILLYLPSRSKDGEGSNLSQRKAEALCRRLVATHCLYGIDKNPLAVELAKLVLWIEAHAEGMPLTFLDHRLVVGDSLTGAPWIKLMYHPSDPDTAIEGLFVEGLFDAFSDALRDAIRYVYQLNDSVGTSVSDLENKRRIKREMDRALLPFKVISYAWSGGVMLGRKRCDKGGYETLLLSVAMTRDLPGKIESRQLLNMIGQGMGLPQLPDAFPDGIERDELYTILLQGDCIPALPYEIMFPEVFFPTGVPHGRKGFHVVLGNPPWDAVRPKAKEFFASFDFEILSAPTKRERTDIEKRLQAIPSVKALHNGYIANIDGQNAIHEVLFQHQVAIVNEEKTGGDPDLAKLFLEKFVDLSR